MENEDTDCSTETLLTELWTADPEFLREIELLEEAKMNAVLALSDEELVKGYRITMGHMK